MHVQVNKVTLMESNPPAFSRASIVKMGENLSYLRPFKASKKGQGQSNKFCVQLHHHCLSV